MINDADLQFRQSENIYRTLIEESPTPIGLYIGRDMIIQVANKAILEIWGKGDDVINKSYHAILPELEGQKIFKILDEVFTTGITYEATEYQLYIERNGEMQKFYFNFTFKPLKDPEGNVWGVINTANDVTELILIRQKLAESEEQTLFALSAAELGTWNFNPLNKSLVWDMRCQELFGFNHDQYIQFSDFLHGIHPNDFEYVKSETLQAIDKDLRKNFDIKFRTIGIENKQLRWIRAKGNAYFNEDNACNRIAGTVQNITREIADSEEQKKLIAAVKLKNDELNDQIKQFEFVTNFMPVQLWTAKTNGELDFVNQRTLDFLGKEAKEIIGTEGFLKYIHPEDQEASLAIWTQSLQSGTPYQYEFRLEDKKGNYKWQLSRALPFINDGKIIKWFGTNTDIDEQKQLQRQKDDFLGIASHELKTPVTSIKAYAQVLGAMLAKEGEQKKAEMVLRMDSQVNRLTNLIGDLLDVTKINSGRLLFNKTWFDFKQVIKETVEDLQHTTQKHKLIQDLAETGQIFSDKDRIGQVVTNLVTNAIKYSPYTDKIIINTKLENNEVVVCVQDFGIGIPEDKADRVFEQFYRVSGDKQHTFPGLGLGLYISSEIIKREGGKMWVNSIEGKGSTFCFSLPLNKK
ncbi:MAG: hypothetical protein JWQ06_74 [Mucilaginibacter sp.]|nr:hypothetical protein [Mucilaginibacter sp.]